MFEPGWYRVTRDIPVVHPLWDDLVASMVVWCNGGNDFTYTPQFVGFTAVKMHILSGDEDALVPYNPDQLLLW